MNAHELNPLQDEESSHLSSTLATSDGDAQQERRGVLTGARILVVEDEFIIAMQLQSIFEEEGAQVLGPYPSLAEGLEHARSEDISAASLDVNLGCETAAPIAALLVQRQVPFMFYSVQLNDPAIAAWRHVRLIRKPAAPHELVRAMAALLQR